MRARDVTVNDGRVTVGVLQPRRWEQRSDEVRQGDIDRLRQVDQRIEIIETEYFETTDLRVRRGVNPLLDLRAEAPPLTDEQLDTLAKVEAVIALDLPFDVGKVAPNLRWVQCMGAGVSQLVSSGLGEVGIRLTTAAGANAVSIAEFVIARILQIAKRLPEIDELQRANTWRPTFGREIAGQTLGVVGLGAIGRQVARKARGLGMTVIASRRSWRPGMTDDDVDALYGPGDLAEMLGRCDVVVAAVPESPDTVRLFDADRFAAMRPGAVFVNVGRGSAVDEQALVDALTSERLSAAALDVVVTEPLPSESVLWRVPNLYISPHSATSPDRYWSNLYALFADNLARYLTGAELINEVDPRTGL